MSVDQLLFIYSDENLNKIYQDFLHRVMAWENFGFYSEVENYKKVNDENKRKEMAEKIFEEFIEENATHELGDVDLCTREYIKSSLEKPSSDLFDELCDLVIDSLANSTIHDFLKDSTYLNYVNKVFPTKNEEEQVSNRTRSWFPCI